MLACLDQHHPEVLTGIEERNTIVLHPPCVSFLLNYIFIAIFCHLVEELSVMSVTISTTEGVIDPGSIPGQCVSPLSVFISNCYQQSIHPSNIVGPRSTLLLKLFNSIYCLSCVGAHQ